MMREEVSVEPKNDSLCCVFCQSEDPDEYGQPVRNEVCACRGDAGCFHLSCLAKFAKTREGRRVCLDTFWLKCITCHQRWTGDTIIDMGRECYAFVCKEYPDHAHFKTYALGVKFQGIAFSNTRSSEEIKCAADELLSAIQETFSGEESIPSDLLVEKLQALLTLGCIAAVCNDPMDAINHYRQAGDCVRALGRDKEIEMIQIQMMIAKAQCALRGGDAAAIRETALPFMRALFDKSKEEYGEDGYSTLSNGYTLASILFRLKQFNEAKQLLPELRLNALRVFGAHHHLTQRIEQLGVSVL